MDVMELLLHTYDSYTKDAMIELEESREALSLPKQLRLFAAVITILIMIVGLAGNSLTIIALCKYPKVRSVATPFIVSLCVADFLFCLIVLPFQSIRFVDKVWVDVRSLCVFVTAIEYGIIGVSLLSISTITINRYIMIAHHHLYNKVYKNSWIACMISFCWLFAYGILIPVLFEAWGKFGYDPRLGTCSIVEDRNGHTPKVFLILFAFVLPCVVIVGCYTKIFCVLHRSQMRMRKHTEFTVGSPATIDRRNREMRRRRSEWRMTKMVLVIFLGFVACYLPITIINAADAEARYPALHLLSHLFLYFSACVNPIIYVIMNKQYRKAYANVIGLSREKKFGWISCNRNKGNHYRLRDSGQGYPKIYDKTTISASMNFVKNSSKDCECNPGT